MRTTPLGLCASATLLRNSPTQNTPIKGEYRIDASQWCKTWHIFRRVQRDRATCKKRVSKGTTSPRGPLGATTAAIFVQHEVGQSIALVLSNRHILALDVAGFVEAFTECSDMARRGIGRPVSDKPNHRHRLLLRA